MDDRQYFEDIEIGLRREFGSHTLSEDEIIAFASKFDPQPFHTDPKAGAESHFGGLVASGWHTGCIAMRLLVDNIILKENIAGFGSPGFDDLRWLKPVRPGDTLSVRSQCVEKRPSQSRPEIGSARFFTEVLNQNDEVVMSYLATGIYLRRPNQNQERE